MEILKVLAHKLSMNAEKTLCIPMGRWSRPEHGDDLK